MLTTFYHPETNQQIDLATHPTTFNMQVPHTAGGQTRGRNRITLQSDAGNALRTQWHFTLHRASPY